MNVFSRSIACGQAPTDGSTKNKAAEIFRLGYVGARLLAIVDYNPKNRIACKQSPTD